MSSLVERLDRSRVERAPDMRGAPPSTDRLGKREFLHLLIAQLRNQDPLRPMEDREFIAQLAQFSSLEALESLDRRLDAMGRAGELGRASALIGKQIQATLPDGGIVSGVVREVRVVEGRPLLVVGDQSVDVSQVISVQS